MSEITLPERFSEYADSRRKGFLKVMELKEAGKQIVGYFCTYTPLEILDAAGLISVSLCGSSNEEFQTVNRDLPRNLCPLIKSSYGQAMEDQCPYAYFSDLIVGETTCDGKKKMYDLLGRKKEMYVLQLPQGVDREYARTLWRREIRRFYTYIQERFHVDITQEDLKQAIRRRNQLREGKNRLQELQRLDPPPMGGFELFQCLESLDYTLELPQALEAVEHMVEQAQSEYARGQRVIPPGTKRLLLTGCPIGGVAAKVLPTVERNGGNVVCFENCNGVKATRFQIPTERPDLLDTLADHYLSIGCSVLSPNQNRLDAFPGLLQEFQVDGVIELTLQACHPYMVEARAIRKLCGSLGVPYLSLETDFADLDQGQIETRVAAFIEML